MYHMYLYMYTYWYTYITLIDSPFWILWTVSLQLWRCKFSVGEIGVMLIGDTFRNGIAGSCSISAYFSQELSYLFLEWLNYFAFPLCFLVSLLRVLSLVCWRHYTHILALLPLHSLFLYKPQLHAFTSLLHFPSIHTRPYPKIRD